MQAYLLDDTLRG